MKMMLDELEQLPDQNVFDYTKKLNQPEVEANSLFFPSKHHLQNLNKRHESPVQVSSPQHNNRLSNKETLLRYNSRKKRNQSLAQDYAYLNKQRLDSEINKVGEQLMDSIIKADPKVLK
jgi:hypothetical protein